MKKLLITYKPIVCALVSMPTLLGMAVPQKQVQQQPEIIRLLDATRKLPPEVLQSDAILKTLFPKDSPLADLEFYEVLKEIREKVIKNLDTEQENNYQDLIEEVTDTRTRVPFKRFKGDTLMETMQAAARIKVGKILNCNPEELETQTCQPLKNSTNPTITDEEKKAYTRLSKWKNNWIPILPYLEIFDTMFSASKPNWKVKFEGEMATINSQPTGYLEAYLTYKGNRTNINYEITQVNENTWPIMSLYLHLFPPVIQNELIKKITHDINNIQADTITISLPRNPELGLIEENKKIFLKKLASTEPLKSLFDITIENTLVFPRTPTVVTLTRKP